MNLRKVFIALCAIGLYCSTDLRAQDIPIGALPTYYNGGFAGEAGALRLASFSHVTRSYYRGETWTSGGTEISADQFVKKLRSGVAFTAGYTGGKMSSNFSTSSTIAPKFSFKGKYTFSPFLNVGISTLNVHDDQEMTNNSAYPSDFSIHTITASTGFLVNSGKWYFGASVNPFGYHLASYPLPGIDRSFFSKMKYSFQAGYTFQRIPESDFSFTPQIVVTYATSRIRDAQTNKMERYSGIFLVDLNLVVRYKRFITGVNNNGIMVGYQNSRFKLQFSNFYRSNPGFPTSTDMSKRLYFNIRPVGVGTHGYSGSLSLRYVFLKKQSPKMPGF
jgi:hypothetical protein